ncbi:MAG: hypothetical protein ACLQBA_16060 [Candidatus Binataceae bacterium]
MRDHRIAVGVSLEGKIREHGFFLTQIIATSRIIEQKHIGQDYPINLEIDKLNYFFSAYLNTIQSLKDASQTATGSNLTWRELSPTYGSFLRYSRNAITHDGSRLINGSQGTKNFIVGPLRRIDDRGDVITFDPPQEDVLTLCCNLSKEVLASLRGFLTREGGNIPTPDADDFKRSLAASLESAFVPEYVKEMTRSNRAQIEASMAGATIDVVRRAFDAITSVESDLASNPLP